MARNAMGASARRSATTRALLVGLFGLLFAVVLLLPSARAFAATTQESMLQDDPAVLRDPEGTMTRLRTLGIDRVRVAVRWLLIAPKPTSRKRPNFKSIDPGAYPAKSWAIWDRIVQAAASEGLELNFNVVGGAPLWATGSGAPKNSAQSNWMPNAREFGAFMHALGVRYSGNYDPKTDKLSPSKPDDLPAVHFWSIWNEPDYGPSLAPQGVPGHPKIEHSPWMYRNLLDAAWTSLQRTGHSRDTILFGEVAPRGYPIKQFPKFSWGIFSGMKPLHFLRMLYCLDDNYHELRGATAAQRGCPATAAGSTKFRSQHPALFKATGFADHPYSRWYPPDVERQNDPDYTSLADIGQLTRALDRVTRIYGPDTKFTIWNTEYGYITSPPKRSPDPFNKVPYIQQSTAAYFDNWAEYISWRNPRIKSFAQYLLSDPEPTLATNDFGGFASGLLTYAQKEKASYGAFRMPLYMPATTATNGRSLEVWGCARPSQYFSLTSPTPQTVAIQLRSGNGSFTTITKVPITNARGYFDARVAFPRNGMVRLAWSYPAVGTYSDPLPVYSRLVHVTVR